MKRDIKIGTSGFHLAQTEYTRLFACVEVQQTFYQPPQLSTLERWRKAAPADFEFTLKAWQLITHEAKSPTYKRIRRKLTETEKSEAGYFKPTPIVREAWAVTLACAKTLRAKTILFQCPASFRQNPQNIANLRQFFAGIERDKLNFGWEPRGAWDAAVVKSLCAELELWHVTDPFAGKTATPRQCYFRLHGRSGWKYKYEEDELSELAEMLAQNQTAYVFFNNLHMTADALQFKEIISKQHR